MAKIPLFSGGYGFCPLCVTSGVLLKESPNKIIEQNHRIVLERALKGHLVQLPRNVQ